ncbi:21576_t:CDS:1 [Gigaspora margarita]|uniref:21576_t:CDS:1 n=1 Tax=Gigaspora margarita TaxID=4874 RepID=A0ABN7VPF4_GIGMA|nr:21576_t:CDS:1 [Gigaspora margarita]
MTNSKSNQHNISNEKISNTIKLLTQENLLSQDDVLLPIDIFSQDDTIEDNELSNVEYKVKELYSLMDRAKIIIDKHTQMPNAKQWINSIDKNLILCKKW